MGSCTGVSVSQVIQKWLTLSEDVWFLSGRSSGVSPSVRSGPFCCLRLVWRVGNMQRWVTPAATRWRSGWHTARRTHTACTNGWVDVLVLVVTCTKKNRHTRYIKDLQWKVQCHHRSPLPPREIQILDFPSDSFLFWRTTYHSSCTSYWLYSMLSCGDVVKLDADLTEW